MPPQAAAPRRSRRFAQRAGWARGGRWGAAVALALVVGTALPAAGLVAVGLVTDRMPRDVARALLARVAPAPPAAGGLDPQRPVDGLVRALAHGLIALDRGPAWREPLPAPPWGGAGAGAGGGDWPPVAPDRSASPGSARRLVRVEDVAALRVALAQAEPGTRIVLAPGRYRIEQTLHTQGHGTAQAPITLASDRAGSAVLEVQATVGLTIGHAHWAIERLVIEGHCPRDTDCEHALHVKGPAHHARIRDCVLRDFNAPIKINREAGAQPDGGEITGCTLVNTRPRHTDRPVTGIDLVAGARWRIHRNHLADFVSTDPRRTTYAAFAKGGARDTVFEANTVVCEQRLRGHVGSRVGLSLGGGGTASEHCRDGLHCRGGEHLGGRLHNNLIVGCSDAGIDLHRAHHAVVAHNTLVDTAGLVGRHRQTQSFLWANWVDGPVREQDEAQLMQDRHGHRQPAWLHFLGLSAHGRTFVNAPTLDLRWRRAPPASPVGEATPADDLCGSARPAQGARPGAFEDFGACLQRP